MKKLRISLKRNKAKWSFTLFDSSESAFYLKDEIPQQDSTDYYRKINLLPKETIEVEWLGSEYIYEDEFDVNPTKFSSFKHEKFDKVRLAKVLSVPSATEKNGYIELYSGWVCGNIFNWVSGSQRKDEPFKTEHLNFNNNPGLSFKDLFATSKMSEEEKYLEKNFSSSTGSLN